MNIHALQTSCRFWQERLRLQDWEVSIRYAPYQEMFEDGQLNWGTILIFPDFVEAEILILDPDEFPEGLTHEIETTIVHELLHLKVYRKDKMSEEQTLNQLAQAFVSLRKK